MDDSALDLSNQAVFSCSDLIDLPSSCSMDDIEEFLNKTHACTHAHTCNTSGPDNSHTHTCYHVHTKIMSAPGDGDDQTPTDDTAESAEKKGKKRPLGNREAVRKYREKKKARTASLEDEVVRLRASNQQLVKRLQGQAVLEAEIARLKCLLVDIRGRIEGEIGSFPYQKPVTTSLPGAYLINPCNMQCGDQLYCLNPGSEGALLNATQGVNDCELENLQCLGNQNSVLKEPPSHGLSNGNDNSARTGSTSGRNKRR